MILCFKVFPTLLVCTSRNSSLVSTSFKMNCFVRDVLYVRSLTNRTVKEINVLPLLCIENMLSSITLIPVFSLKFLPGQIPNCAICVVMIYAHSRRGSFSSELCGVTASFCEVSDLVKRPSKTWVVQFLQNFLYNTKQFNCDYNILSRCRVTWWTEHNYSFIEIWDYSVYSDFNSKIVCCSHTNNACSNLRYTMYYPFQHISLSCMQLIAVFSIKYWRLKCPD